MSLCCGATPAGGSHTGSHRGSRIVAKSWRPAGEGLWKSVVLARWLPKASCCIVPPWHHLVRKWNVLVALLLIIEAPLLPLQLAFAPDEKIAELPWLLCLRVGVEVVFGLDLVAQFFVQVQPEGQTLWIASFHQIAWEYLKGSFFVDLFSVLPLGWLLATAGLIATKPCTIVLLSFHRLLRFMRAPRVASFLEPLTVVQAVMQLSYSWRRLGRAIVSVLFCAHVMGCLWAALAVCNTEEFTWFQYLREQNRGNDFYSDSGPVHVYTCALYWAVFTITGIGYGDVVPYSPVEYGVTMLCGLLASLMWAWLLANIISITLALRQGSSEHYQTLDCIGELLRVNKVGGKLGSRLREYFVKKENVKALALCTGIVEGLSPELKLEVVYALHGHWIQKVRWLRNLPRDSHFVVQLTQHLKATLHTPGEFIPSSAEFVVLHHGLCIRGGKLMSSGDSYGEDLLLNNEALRKDHPTLALTFLHRLVISKAVFEGLVAEHPEVAKPMRWVFIFYAVLRGVIRKADEVRGAPSALGLLGLMEEAQVAQTYTSPALDDLLPDPATRNEVLCQRVGELEGQIRSRLEDLEELVGSLCEQAKLLKAR